MGPHGLLTLVLLLTVTVLAVALLRRARLPAVIAYLCTGILVGPYVLGWLPETAEGRLLGHVHLGLRLVEERAEGLADDARAELLHAIAGHHDLRSARTAEAAVLYHANQLDAAAAIRPVQSA